MGVPPEGGDGSAPPLLSTVPPYDWSCWSRAVTWTQLLRGCLRSPDAWSRGCSTAEPAPAPVPSTTPGRFCWRKADLCTCPGAVVLSVVSGCCGTASSGTGCLPWPLRAHALTEPRFRSCLRLDLLRGQRHVAGPAVESPRVLRQQPRVGVSRGL